MAMHRSAKSTALVAGCVLSCACATTRYTQSRIETVPPEVKGRRRLPRVGRDRGVEDPDREPRPGAAGSDDPAPLAAARLRAARARVLLRPGAGRLAGRRRAASGARAEGVPTAPPGLGFDLAFDVAVTPETQVDLVLGGLARGPKRLAPVTLRLARHAGRSYDRLYWLEAIGYVLSAAVPTLR